MENTQQQILDGRELRGGGNARLLIDGVPFVNFSGCNYLALTDSWSFVQLLRMFWTLEQASLDIW